MRPAFRALWDLDLALADVVATSSDRYLGAIRMAWWRERLEELDLAERAVAEPRLHAIAAELLPRGVSGFELSQLEDAWLPLIEPFPWAEPAAVGLKARGRLLFGLGARLLGSKSRGAEAAGAIWSLVDGAEHCSDGQSRELLLKEARLALNELPEHSPRAIRPLTVLTALAAADIIHDRSGAARLLAAIRHRLRGTFPR